MATYTVTVRHCGTDHTNIITLTPEEFFSSVKFWGSEKYKFYHRIDCPISTAVVVELHYGEQLLLLQQFDKNESRKQGNFHLHVVGDMLCGVTINVSDWLKFPHVKLRWERYHNAKREKEKEIAEHNNNVYEQVIKKRCKHLRHELKDLDNRRREVKRQKTAIEEEVWTKIKNATMAVQLEDFNCS